jgi:uncharacterized protein (DUF433 family)
MSLDWSQCAAVESVPGKVSGAWVFRGTRIPVAAVFENLEDGFSLNELVRMFDGLTREQVQAVLDFTGQSLEISRRSDYLLSEIKKMGDRPTLAEMRDRLHARKPVRVEIDTARLVREER